MVPANLLLYLLIWLLMVFNLDFANSREFQFQKHSNDLPSPSIGCVINCTNCPYPCRTLPPPPPPPNSGGYPLYGTPPPPSPGSSYPSYRAPPPPLPPAQRGCPPGPVQCCHYPPPLPPNTYTYVPDGNHSPFPYLPLSLFSLVTLLMPFAVLF